MAATDFKNLTPEQLAAARITFIAFFGPQGWAELSNPEVDLFSLYDSDLANLWDGWLARTVVIKIQSVEQPGEVNDWFCSLEEGHQKMLLEGKWPLADATYRAGMNKHLNTAITDFSVERPVSVVVAQSIESSENEALKMRVAMLEGLLARAGRFVGNVDAHDADLLDDEIEAALEGKAEYKPKLLLPPKEECEDGYPSDDAMQAWAVNRTIDSIASMNGHLDCEVVVNSKSPAPLWPVLRKPAKVGSTIFSEGVSSLLVIKAAERAHEFSLKSGQEADRLSRLAETLGGIHGGGEA